MGGGGGEGGGSGEGGGGGAGPSQPSQPEQGFQVHLVSQSFAFLAHQPLHVVATSTQSSSGSVSI